MSGFVRILRGAFCFLTVLLICSYAYMFFFGGKAFRPFYWYFVIIGLGLALYLLAGLSPLPRRAVWRGVVWSLAFALAMSLSYLLMNSTAVALDTLLLHGGTLSVMCIMALHLQAPQAYRAGRLALLIVLLIAVAVNWAEFFLPQVFQFSNVGGRSAGLYVNANICGNILVLGMSVAVFALPRWLRVPFCLVILAGVIVTFSRASLLMWALSVLLLAWYRAFPLPRVASVTAVGATLLLAGATLVSGQWIGLFRAAGADSRLTGNTLNRISGDFFEQKDTSSRLRRQVALRGLDLYLHAPLFGYGIGATQKGYKTQVAVHNTYLRMGVDMGSIGIGLIVALLVILWKTATPEGRTLACAYAVSNLFSHNNLEQPAVMIVLAFALASSVALSQPRAPA